MRKPVNPRRPEPIRSHNMLVRHAILNNLAWKLGATLIALVIYFTIDANLPVELNRRSLHTLLFRPDDIENVRFPVPVAVNTRSTDKRVFVLTPAEVDVTLRGSQKTLNNLKKSDVKVFVDLGAAPDSQIFRQKVELYVPPGLGVEVVGATPSEVTIERVDPPEPPLESPPESSTDQSDPP